MLLGWNRSSRCEGDVFVALFEVGGSTKKFRGFLCFAISKSSASVSLVFCGSVLIVVSMKKQVDMVCIMPSGDRKSLCRSISQHVVQALPVAPPLCGGSGSRMASCLFVFLYDFLHGRPLGDGDIVLAKDLAYTVGIMLSRDWKSLCRSMSQHVVQGFTGSAATMGWL